VVGLGRVELPTYGLGRLRAVLTRYEKFGLYYISQHDTTTPMLNRLYPFRTDLTQKVSQFYHTEAATKKGLVANLDEILQR
jgi:hypothetical protein